MSLPLSVTGTTPDGGNGGNAVWGASCGDGGNIAPDAAYQWTAPADGTYAIDTNGSDFDTILSVRTADCAGTELSCNDDYPGLGVQSRVLVALTEGQTVVIVVDGFGTASGNYVLNVDLAPEPTPTPTPTETPAITCPQFYLDAALPTPASGTTSGTSGLGGASCGDGGSFAPEAIYQWTAPAAGAYTIDTFGSTFDTLLYVRDAGCWGTELACNDDASLGTLAVAGDGDAGDGNRRS